MEKKYYFRGLGLGIIVTAVIMGIALSGSGKKPMTDDEVIARAKQLGMIEDSTLLEAEASEADVSGAEEEAADPGQDIEEPQEGKKDTAVKKDAAAVEPEPSAQETSPGPEKAAEAEKPDGQELPSTQAAEKPETDTKPAENTNEMNQQDAAEASASSAAGSVTIISGDSSYTIAKKLADAGLVSSASGFDDFLCEKGYDKRLRTGTFQIPANASDEQIARIVTGQ